MIIELFIYSENEVYVVDVDDFELSTIYSVENIKNIDNRKDNITKDFAIKATKKNKQAFSFLENLSRFSATESGKELGVFFQPNRQVDCKLFANNIQIIKGKLLIKDSTTINDVSTYNCSITGNVVSFFKNLSDRYLHELDSFTLNAENRIDYNYTTVTNLFLSKSNQKDYFFPMLDYGIDNRTGQFDNWDSNYEFLNYRPAFYVEAYLKAIFKGFVYDNEKWTQIKNNVSIEEYKINYEPVKDILSQLFIPNNDQLFTVKDIGRLGNFEFDNVSIYPSPTTNYAHVVAGVAAFKYNYVHKYYQGVLIPKFTTYDSTPFKNEVTNIYSIKTKDKYLKSFIKCAGSITIPKNSRGNWKVGIIDISKERKVTDNNFKVFTTIIKDQTDTAQTYVFDVKGEVENVAGEYLFAWYRSDQSVNGIGLDGGIHISNVVMEIGDFTFENEVEVHYDDLINTFEHIPKNIKITDFLKSLMTMFNLYLSEDNDIENSFKLETYTDFYKNVINFNVADAVDWSVKADWSNYSLKTNINLPKSYKYLFEEDEDMMNVYYTNRYAENYGDYQINNSNGTDDEQEIKVIFAPTINLNHSKNEKMLPVLYKSDGFLEGEKVPFKSKLRLLYNNGMFFSKSSFDTKNRDELIYNSTIMNNCSMFKGVESTGEVIDTILFNLPKEYYTSNFITTNYNLTLFNKYYQYQVKELINSDLMILEIDVHLNEIDINNLDFKNMVYLSNSKYGNAYWKLLEVDYKNNTTTSKVKLQKIIN